MAFTVCEYKKQKLISPNSDAQVSCQRGKKKNMTVLRTKLETVYLAHHLQINLQLCTSNSSHVFLLLSALPVCLVLERCLTNSYFLHSQRKNMPDNSTREQIWNQKLTEQSKKLKESAWYSGFGKFTGYRKKGKQHLKSNK